MLYVVRRLRVATSHWPPARTDRQFLVSQQCMLYKLCVGLRRWLFGKPADKSHGAGAPESGSCSWLDRSGAWHVFEGRSIREDNVDDSRRRINQPRPLNGSIWDVREKAIFFKIGSADETQRNHCPREYEQWSNEVVRVRFKFPSRFALTERRIISDR